METDGISNLDQLEIVKNKHYKHSELKWYLFLLKNILINPYTITF